MKWIKGLRYAGLALVMLTVFSFKSDTKPGIHFIESGWGDAVKQAKADDKPMFVFIRTTTCAISKKMDTQIFKDKTVGDFFNQHFVCTKLDPDNVMDNLRVSNWGATAVPTYVFLDKKRKKVHMASGFEDPKSILKEAQEALNKMGEGPDQ